MPIAIHSHGFNWMRWRISSNIHRHYATETPPKVLVQPADNNLRNLYSELAGVCICIFITRIIFLQFHIPFTSTRIYWHLNVKRDKVQSCECMKTCARNAQSKQNSSKIKSKILFSYSQFSIGLSLDGGDAGTNEKTSPVEIYANNKLMLSQ